MLTLHTVAVQHRGNRLLGPISQTFAPGQFSALLGPNGAGKSTLLKSLSGDVAAEGDIYLHGRPLRSLTGLTRARHLGVLPQASSLAFPFTAGEVVELGTAPLTQSHAECQRRVQAAMAQCQCDHLQHRPYPQLSGGEKQRVQLARVLVQLTDAEQPAVLLLDEPTAAQDLGQQHHLLALLRELTRRLPLITLAVLHDLNQVLRYCDHCLLLDRGALVAAGAPAQVLTPARVADHWHYRPRAVPLPGGIALL